MKFMFVFLLLVGLSACQDTTQPPGPIPTGAVSSTVSPAGQTLKMVSDSRVEVTFEFPPGAVASQIQVSIQERPAEAGQFISLNLSPSGYRFLKPVQVSVTVPAGQSVGGEDLIYFGAEVNAQLLPTTRDATNSKLSAQINAFETVPSTSSQNRQSNQGSELNAGLIQLNLRIQIADRYLTEYIAHPNAANLDVLIRALDLVAQAGTGDATTFLNLSKTRLCTAYQSVTDNAAVVVVDNVGKLKSTTESVLDLHAAISRLGATCSVGYLAVIQSKLDQFTTFAETEIQKPDFSAEPLEQALQELLGVWRTASGLGLENATSVMGVVAGRLVPEWRTAAYSACQQGRPSGRRSLYHIANDNLQTIYPGLEVVSVIRDLNFCDFKVTAKIISPLARTLEAKNLGGGSTPGNATESWSARSPVTGKLHLEADFLPTFCPNTDSSPIELTLFRADTSLVKRWQSTSTLSIFEDIDLVSLLGGAEPTTLETQNFILIRSAACDGKYPISSLNLRLMFNPKPKLEGATATPNTLLSSANFTTQNFSLQFKSSATIVKIHDVAALLPNGGSLTDDHVAGQFVVDTVNNKITFGTSVRVQCSEKGKPTLQNIFQLIDDLDQTSNQQSTNISIDYNNC